MTESSTPEGVWLREKLPTGERYWVTAARRYTQHSHFREAITPAINTMVWYPPVGTLPWGPGMAVQHVVRETQISRIGGVGISHSPINIPEDDYLDGGTYGPVRVEDLHPDFMASYDLVGVRQLTSEGWSVSYWLDKGTAICGVALETQTVHRPPNLAARCALQDHSELVACGCDCGCTNRATSSTSGGEQS